MQLSDKQKSFWNEPYHRWNIKHGATRSGKTYLDYFVIPRSIRELKGKAGLIVLMGNTKGTLQRNVIEPMQNIYGADLVSDIKSDNTANMFGERVHCLGADNRRHVDRVRGMSIKYCYGDEVATWEQEVFEMLKSRLDKQYSRFDGTCNPRDPDHWFKQFLDSDADIFQQQYTLYDNPFLAPEVLKALEKEHSGVFFDRYILGKWCVAEGLVFPYFGNNSERWVTTIESDGTSVIREKNNKEQLSRISIGLDFGATGSVNAMHATGFVGNFERMIVLDEHAMPRGDCIDTEGIANACADFCEKVRMKYGRYDNVFFDAADPALGNRVAAVLRGRGLPYRNVSECYKTPLESRPVSVDGFLCSDRLTIDRNCTGLIKALSQLRWDSKNKSVPEDINAGNINDFWDSFNYSWSTWTEYLNRRKPREGVRKEIH